MGTGFGTRGVCTHWVCPKKILRPPPAAAPPGCEFLGNFSPWGVGVHRGVNFRKKLEI